MTAAFLAPEILKPRRTQFRVPHRVLNVFVAQVGLQRPSVVSPVSQCVAAGVPKHVRVNALELSCFASARDHLGEAGCGKRRTTLGGEHKRRIG